MTAPEPAATSPANLPPRGEFDEEAYLQLHPDIAQGIAAGTIESGWAHFARAGCAEGRAWLRQPDPFAGVNREISSGDTMFRGNAAHYFAAGASARQCVFSALATGRRAPDAVRRILDLPCGHGRVLRFLRRDFPAAEIVACDLDRPGVDYCARTFGAVPVYSDVNLAALTALGQFDLIWCGSLLTHLDATRSAEFLRFFQQHLAPRGILVFTLHGRPCQRELAAAKNRHGLDDAQIATLLRDYDASGCAYVDYRDASGYGFSLTHPHFVTRTLLDSGWQLLGYHEAGWDERQDAIALQLDASPR